jgi:hypothetical protein
MADFAASTYSSTMTRVSDNDDRRRKPPPESLVPVTSSNDTDAVASIQSSGEKTREEDVDSQRYTNEDRELERALRASKQQYEKEQKRRNDEKEQMERAMKESLVMSPPPYHHRDPRQKQQQQLSDDKVEVILIDDKISSKQETGDDIQCGKLPTANHCAATTNNYYDDMEIAIRLSLDDHAKVKHDEFQHPNCRVLSRTEFEDILNPWIERQGGFDKIEKGKMVKTGNAAGDVKNNKTQSRAQYGRYNIREMWRVFDVLEGKIDVKDNDCCENGKSEQNDNHSSLLGSKITAFVDIGHGIGIQVMQAGWSLDVYSRGIELMEERNKIAELISFGVIAELSDPPNETKVKFRLEDLRHCILPPPGMSERNEELREFVLFRDKPETMQKGLVIFANNAEDVFAARSNDKGCGASLDEHLAEIFGNMKVGGRMVTLTDIRVHLTSKDDSKWYHYHSFDSGVGAVSWSPNKSVNVHVLTKISDEWMCSNAKFQCPPSNVVNVETGKLTTECLYCGEAPRRHQQRTRKKRKIYGDEIE